MVQLLADARLALRTWRKTPALTIVVIASIALGIGATTAVFTLVDQVLLRRLPVAEPDALVQITKCCTNYGANWGDGSELSYPMYAHLRDHNQVFEGVMARFGAAVHFGDAARTERVLAEVVSGTYFPVLGIEPAVGRLLNPEDDRTPGAPAVVVLSHAFWSSRYAADPAIVGRTAVVNNLPYTIIGVAREGFDGIELGRPAQVFLPITMKAQLTPAWNGLDDPRFAWVRVFARLKAGLGLEQASASLQPLYRAQLQHEILLPGFARATEQVRQRYLGNEIRLLPGGQGRSGLRSTTAAPLWMLLAIAGGVLLIACANVANLLLARAAGRQREMAIRLALGAGRRRLVQQLLVESILLALAGGAAGLLISIAGAPLVLNFFVSPEIPEPVSTLPDARILAFTLALSAVTGIVFGLAPALQSGRADVAPTLKDQAGAVVGGGHARFRKVLVASQVAVSLLLVVGALLFMRTLGNLLAVDIGFQTESLISFSIDPSANGYPPERARQFIHTLRQRLEQSPGVAAVGFATMRLLDGGQWNGNVTIEGREASGDAAASAQMNAVSPGYFRAMGIPVLIGREFTERDARTSPPPSGAPEFTIAIVNEAFVRSYLDGRQPIGRRVGMGADPGTATPIEIVAVVRDSKYTGVRDETRPQIFFPQLEQTRPGGFTAYVRTTQPADAAFAVIRSTVQGIDSNLPVHSTRTLERQVQQSLRNERMIATMASVFGVLATLLAVVGLYGVMSYTVSRRTREIGVRIALGATRGQVRRLVLGETFGLLAAGLGTGLLLAAAGTRAIRTLLFQTPATDVATYGAVLGVFAAIAFLASWVPLRRALNVDPTVALRWE